MVYPQKFDLKLPKEEMTTARAEPNAAHVLYAKIMIAVVSCDYSLQADLLALG